MYHYFDYLQHYRRQITLTIMGFWLLLIMWEILCQTLPWQFCNLKCEQELKAFMQKGHISLFGPIFLFCRINLIVGRLTCFDMKSIVPWLFLLICTSFSRNNVWKKLSFSLETFCWMKTVMGSWRKTKETFCFFKFY